MAKIKEVYPELNLEWLIAGAGEMLCVTEYNKVSAKNAQMQGHAFTTNKNVKNDKMLLLLEQKTSRPTG